MTYRAFGAFVVLVCLVCLALTANAGDMNNQDQLASGGGALSWNSFMGGSGNDCGRSIAVDASGNVYVTGNSDTTWGSPLRPYSGEWDGFVAKFSSNGTLIWNTFLGGVASDSSDGITVDTSENVYVTGNSNCTWGTPLWPYVSNGDAFVAKLNNNGPLLWNTFLGGSGNDSGYDVAVDSSGDVYVTGHSHSTWGAPVRPFTPSAEDAFVAGLDSNGSLLWNTFLGGGDWDSGCGITAGADGYVYVTGYSWTAWGSPVRAFTSGGDAFVAKLICHGWLHGTLVWNTFLGGNGEDSGVDMAMDPSGYVYVVGSSSATWGSPIVPYTSIYHDGFIAKLDNNGACLWNTFVGGLGDDYCDGIGLDRGGSLFVTGESSATWGSPQRPYTASSDVFIAKFDSNGLPLWNTFLGGAGSDRAAWSIALDNSGNVYATGYSYAGWGSPIHAFTSVCDAFVARLGGSGVAITSISSKTSKPGSSATIYGTGFSADKKKDVMYFGTKKAKSINRAKATSLKLTIPKVKKGSVGVYVVVNGVSSNTYQFEVK